MKAVNGVSHSPKTANIFLIRSRMTDFKLEKTWAYEAPRQCNFSRDCVPFDNVNVKTAIAKRLTSVISFSSVLDVSVSGTVCSLIFTILHSLELGLLANYSCSIELISIPTMGLLMYDYI